MKILDSTTQLPNANKDVLNALAEICQVLKTVQDSLIKGEGQSQQFIGQVDKISADFTAKLNSIEQTDYEKTITKPLVTQFENVSRELQTITEKLNDNKAEVTVEPPDLEPIVNKLEALPLAIQEAVNKLAPEADLMERDELDKHLKQITKLLKEISDKKWINNITGGGGSNVPIVNNAVPVVNRDGSNVGGATGLLPFEFDDIQFSNPDANGNYQTAVVENNGATVATLTLSYDDSSKLTGVSRT